MSYDSERKVISLPATLAEERYPAPGSKLFVESCSAPFELIVGHRNRSTVKSGWRANYATPDEDRDAFNTITVKRITAGVLNAVIWVGNSRVDFNFPATPATSPVSTVGTFAGNVTVTAGVITAGSGNLVSIPGIATGATRYSQANVLPGARRRQIIITNYQTNDMVVTDSLNNLLARFGNPSGASTSFTFESDADLKIGCVGGSQDYCVAEIFYL